MYVLFFLFFFFCNHAKSAFSSITITVIMISCIFTPSKSDKNPPILRCLQRSDLEIRDSLSALRLNI